MAFQGDDMLIVKNFKNKDEEIRGRIEINLASNILEITKHKETCLSV